MAQSKLTPLVKKSKMRSTPEARRLIRAYIRHYGSEHKAAKALHMTQAQLNGIKTGRLKDTPAMKIALDRAEARARRAWMRIDGEHCSALDAPATLRAAQRALDQASAMIAVLVKASSDNQ